MPLDAYGAFLIVVFNIFFWIFVLFRNPLNDLTRSFFWWSFFISAWALGYGITLSGLFDYETTFAWNRFCQAMVLFVPPIFFQLCCQVARRFEPYKFYFRIYLLICGFNALALLMTDLYVKGLWSFGPYRWQPLGGPLYSIFTFLFFWCTLHGFWIVIWNYHSSQGVHRKQLTLFLWGTAIPYFGGATLFLQAYQIPVPSTGVFLILTYVFVIAYAVYRYQFFRLDDLIALIHRERVNTLGLMAASVNHEIKNPLYVIRGSAQVCSDKIETYLREPKEEHLKTTLERLATIEEQTSKAFEIMKRFAAFAKKEMEATPKKSQVALSEVLREVLFLLNHEFSMEGIQLKTEIPENFPLLYADARHVEETLLNLIKNACDAIRGKGWISVRAHYNQKKVFVEIEDSGEGIKPENLSKIFEPFFTLKHTGTGLGLYIVKQLMEDNGGKISVSSPPGKGALFILEFQRI